MPMRAIFATYFVTKSLLALSSVLRYNDYKHKEVA